MNDSPAETKAGNGDTSSAPDATKQVVVRIDQDRAAEQTPEEVGRMAEAAMAAVSEASRQLRELGAMAERMGTNARFECNSLADDFEQHGGTIAKHITDYGDKMYRLTEAIMDVRTKLRDGDA